MRIRWIWSPSVSNMSSSVVFRLSAFMIFSFCFTISLLYALATLRSKSERLDLAARVIPDSRSTNEAAMKPLTSASILAIASSRSFSVAIVPLSLSGGRRRHSADLQFPFDGAHLVAGHGQVRALLVEHHVDEHGVVLRHG